MIIKTKNFGNVEVQDTDVINFEEGVPGFPNEKKFVVLFDNTKEESPFMWLQAVDNSELTFVVVDPFWFKPDYKFNIDVETKNQLDIQNPEDVLVLSVVVIPEDMSKITANLKAPLLVNHRTHKGKQYILENDKYSVRHYIMDELERNFSSAVKPNDKKCCKTASEKSKCSCKTGGKTSCKKTE